MTIIDLTVLICGVFLFEIYLINHYLFIGYVTVAWVLIAVKNEFYEVERQTKLIQLFVCVLVKMDCTSFFFVYKFAML